MTPMFHGRLESAKSGDPKAWEEFVTKEAISATRLTVRKVAGHFMDLRPWNLLEDAEQQVLLCLLRRGPEILGAASLRRILTLFAIDFFRQMRRESRQLVVKESLPEETSFPEEEDLDLSVLAPRPQERLVMDALLAGYSVRDIAKMARKSRRQITKLLSVLRRRAQRLRRAS